MNMTKNTDNSYVNFFWLELAIAMVSPFIICWGIISTNVLNSNIFLKLLENIGLLGSVFILFGGIPLGIIGIKKAKRMKKLQVATIAFSIINLTVGIIEIIILILLFCSVIFGGISA